MGLIESRAKKKEKLKTEVEEFLNRLQIALIGCGQARNTFTTLSDLWSTSRGDAITILSDIADQIDRHHFNVNIANLTGTTSSIAGGAASISSLVLAPFSGGASVALAAGGIFGTVAGTATTLGANVAEVLLTKELMEKAKNVFDTDIMYTKALSDAFKELIIHENNVFAILAELQNRSFTNDLNKILKSGQNSHRTELELNTFMNGETSFEDMLALLSCLYAEDNVFLNQLRKTPGTLLKEAPSLSSTVSTSSDFFQALKELSTLGPEAMKGIGGAAMQSTASSGANAASVGAQMVTLGLGAVFVALDVYQFVKISKNFDEGSKTELAEKIRDCVSNLKKEKDQVENLSNFYKERMKKALSTGVLSES